MAEDDGDKTQDATAHRRDKAREEGQFPRSQDLASAATLLAGLCVLLWFGGSLATFMEGLMRTCLGGEAWLSVDKTSVTSTWNDLMIKLAQTLLPILAMIVGAAVAVSLLQTGIVFLPNKIGMDFNHVNPMKGMSRIFSMANVVRLIFGLFKLAIIAAVAWNCISGKQQAIVALWEQEVGQIAMFLIETAIWTSIKIAVALIILALLDYLFQRWKFEKDLRMTQQEVREEFKTLQGDPHILSKRRSMQRQMAMSRIKGAIPKADVVVTNPTELAIALQYDPEKMAAPVVVAKGAGVLAQRIRRLALEHHIPIVERKEVARALYENVDIGKAIPAEQYAAVAEILKYVYELTGKKMPNMGKVA